MANIKTLAIKARLANHIRKTLYKTRLEQISQTEKVRLFEEIFGLNSSMHSELNDYKAKRKAKIELHKKRLASPQTKSMKKKLGLIPKTPKKNLENSK